MSTHDDLTFAVTREVRDHCLCLAAQRAARALARRFDDVLRPTGLKSGQFSLLMSLNRPEAPVIGDVAALLAMDRTTLTANVKPLVRRRLVRVAVDRGDRRSRRLHLTSAGRDLLTNAVAVWRKENRGLERKLKGSGAVQLRADLARLAARQGNAPRAT